MRVWCPRCGTPADVRFPACHVCGTPRQAQPYAQPQPYPYPQQPLTWAQRARASSSASLGCGIAGLFGVLLVVVAVGLAVFFASTAAERARSGAVRSPASDGPREEPRGSLRDNVPERVGDYRVATLEPARPPDSIEGMLVHYQKGDRELSHLLGVFADGDDARDGLAGATKAAAEKAQVAPVDVKIRDAKGKLVGKAVRFAAEPEVLVYQMGRLVGIVSGPNGDVVPFFQALPY